MWISVMLMMVMMMMSRVQRVLSLVAGDVVFKQLRGHSVWAFRLGGRRGRNNGTLRNVLRSNSARFMSAGCSLLRLKGLLILGFFLFSFLVGSPFILKPGIYGLGRPFCRGNMEQGMEIWNGQSNRLDSNPTHDKKETRRGLDEEGNLVLT